ncbi:MAG: DUF4838 domain-containing protein [Clostridia bacterium]|nr:DUF4838 domain-containing protein [Clostridia bacterium]
MKNKFKIGVCALAICLLVSNLASCGGGNQSSDSSEKPLPEGGEHGGVVGETDHMLVEDGNSEYKLVIPVDADVKTKKAANEFETFFSEATDIELEVITDAQATWSDTAKYISLGNTSLLETANIEINEVELGQQGYEIRTVGQSIFVASAGGFGALYGAYDLLGHLVGYEQFTSNHYSLDTNVSELTLPNFEIKEVPDFEYRIAPYGAAFTNSVFRERMRMFHDQEVYIENAQVHTMLRTILPTKTHDTSLKDKYDNGTLEKDYEEEHPYWFMDSKQQLCYTAHGDPEEYEALITEIVENCKKLILSDPDHDYISLTQMDVNVWCSCNACSALKNKYGTNAASQIILANDVAERVEKWLEDEQVGRKIQFVIFAYHQTEKAPAIRNSDGTYSAIDEEVILRDNISVQIAPISANYIDSIYAEENVTLYNLTESWVPCAKSFCYWGYDCYFGSYLTPYNTYGSMQDAMTRLYEMNAKIVWMQGAYNLRAQTGFDDVKTYLWSKLMWNVKADVNALIQNFFDNVYQDAGQDMYNAFLQMRVGMELQKTKDLNKGIWSQPATSVEWWDKRMLVQMLETFEVAKTKIESYQLSDLKLYQAIMDNIVKESIFPRYVLIEAYGSTYSNTELAQMKSSFRADVERLDINALSEGISTSDYFNANGY